MELKKVKLFLAITFLFVNDIQADTTLSCKAGKKCDAYFENCESSDFTFTVNIEPKNRTVSIGNVIPADFSNPAEVRFNYLRYKVRINRYEYSAILFNEKETITTWCNKIEAAW